MLEVVLRAGIAGSKTLLAEIFFVVVFSALLTIFMILFEHYDFFYLFQPFSQIGIVTKKLVKIVSPMRIRMPDFLLRNLNFYL